MKILKQMCLVFFLAGIVSTGYAYEPADIADWQIGGAAIYHRNTDATTQNLLSTVFNDKFSYSGALFKVKRNFRVISLEGELGFASDEISSSEIDPFLGTLTIKLKGRYINTLAHLLYNIDAYESGILYIGGGGGAYFENVTVKGYDDGVEFFSWKMNSTLFGGDIFAGLEHYFNDNWSLDLRGKYIFGSADIKGWALQGGLNYSFR